MSSSHPASSSPWSHGPLPSNVIVGDNTLITAEYAFRRFQSREPGALRIGAHCTMDGVHFAIGAEGRVGIGDYCYFTNVILLCELELQIGSYVAIGWNTTIADSDFHPLDPAQRIADAVACSPLGASRARPAIPRRAVLIEDDVWIGPCATILKGVRLGAGCRVQAGSLVTRDVPAGASVGGNPAHPLEGRDDGGEGPSPSAGGKPATDAP